MRLVRRRRRGGSLNLRSLLSRGNNFLKQTKVISHVANALHKGGVGGKYNSHIGKIGSFAAEHGYGMRRHRTRRGRGKFGDFMRKANDWLKKTKVVSTVANALGGVGVPYASTVGSVAGHLGYGRKRRRRTHTRKRTGVRRVRRIAPMTHHRVRGLGRRRHRVRRGRGYPSAQTGVGIGGMAQYSKGLVLF